MMRTMMSTTRFDRCYSGLIRIPTLEGRYEYLKLGGIVGARSFGSDRYLNQILYKCNEWLSVRDGILIRDNGCEFGLTDYPIKGNVIVHHINPITIEDIQNRNPKIFNPENLICVSLRTHNAVHYGDDSQLPKPPIVRRPGDTCPWR